MSLPAATIGRGAVPDPIRGRLSGFWAQDAWDMAVCPLLPAGTPSARILRFSCTSPSLNDELKFACWQKFVTGAWSPRLTTHAYHLHRICSWLNQVADQLASLFEHPLEWWEQSLRAYLTEQGAWRTVTRTRLSHTQHLQVYTSTDPTLVWFRQLYLLLRDAADTRPEYEKDRWDIRKLGLVVNASASEYKITFTQIRQPWLYSAAKRYSHYRLAIITPSTCRKEVEVISAFSAFLAQVAPDLAPGALDRRLLVTYIGHLATSGLAPATRARHLIQLRTFLECCAQEGWAPLPAQRLIYDEDIPHRNAPTPRFIPQEVMDQLNSHVNELAPHYRRMVLILQECGMRISELLTLSYNCLSQDASGDWFLRYYQHKLKKEHTIPISAAVATTIREQQATAPAPPSHGALLFPTPKGQPYKRHSFVQALNDLAYANQIRDAAGELWHFEPHQFRHTVATRMINNGVRQHFVQRYLGHESPEMTSRYAHIHDETLKHAFYQFRGREVDITGRTVEHESATSGAVNATEAQWLKRNIQAQALPNGRCALPAAASACPHANACLTCVHFRTDASFLPIHQAQLATTHQVLETARANDWTRMVEMNERVATNLERIMIALEQHTP